MLKPGRVQSPCMPLVSKQRATFADTPAPRDIATDALIVMSTGDV